jgi:hypothetical protein
MPQSMKLPPAAVVDATAVNPAVVNPAAAAAAAVVRYDKQASRTPGVHILRHGNSRAKCEKGSPRESHKPPTIYLLTSIHPQFPFSERCAGFSKTLKTDFANTNEPIRIVKKFFGWNFRFPAGVVAPSSVWTSKAHGIKNCFDSSDHDRAGQSEQGHKLFQ